MTWKKSDISNNANNYCQCEFGPEFKSADSAMYNKYGSSDNDYGAVKCKWKGPLGKPQYCCINGNQDYLNAGLNVNCHPDFISSDPDYFPNACSDYVGDYCDINPNSTRCINWKKGQTVDPDTIEDDDVWYSDDDEDKFRNWWILLLLIGFIIFAVIAGVLISRSKKAREANKRRQQITRMEQSLVA
jgi:hypothetical protein